jgi:hypothetical protein
VSGCCEYGDEPSGSGTTELVAPQFAHVIQGKSHRSNMYLFKLLSETYKGVSLLS